jgi:hypothetical protein
MSLLIYQWPIANGRVQAFTNQQRQTPRFQINFNNGSTEKIDEVVTDLSLADIQSEQYSLVLPQLAAKIAPLGDGSHKLYLHFTLKGGMIGGGFTEQKQKDLANSMGMMELPCAELAEKLKKELSYSSYRAISVHPVDHAFETTDGVKVRSRKITLDLTGIQSVDVFFKGLGAAIFCGYGADHFKHDRNPSYLENAILGDQSPAAKNELMLAHKRGDRLDLYISQDLEHIELKYTESVGLEVSRQKCIIL